MSKILLPTLILVFTGLVLSSLKAGAAETSTVTATVTAQNVSVTVSDNSVTYGTMSLGSSKSTITLSDTQTATNAGNVTSQLNIKGQNSTGWTLAGTAGSDQYVHKFCVSSCSTPPTNYTALTVNYQTLSASIAASGTQNFDLELTVPNSSSTYTQQSVDVIVQAVAL
ncbi:hypothetical protein A3K01_00290 [candidate division WWE3 bacterium RIFOXYD1_FULL_43_17]|uniref:WxL domain-containing protein n=3 Tax=Katanobacteria TaxID=422282 RepID=A0A1F4XC17_UNCKA|nr:MAG: hypothetical protein UU59_C0005G0012 [candidate division WWE3 bacterium GW2011_GWE1_41_27]KKS60680.1 MAG: hypothetical protein UV26_C0002G0006 [candidate division WWE3 bacterium GW2011_GWF2_42_42]OGC79225.1 MAG: hypothetical protein A3K01_00290 [candidate division WWE3 bacterium RIFOXYD1_FULL_43_17]